MHVDKASPAKAMAGRSRGSRWRPVGEGSGKGWMESTRDRFADRARLAVGSGSAGVPDETVTAALQRLRSLEAPPARAGVFARAPEETTDGEEAVEPVATASPSSVFQAAIWEHRTSSGLRASGFEPQRNTFFVCGRPVQVFQCSKKIPSIISGVSNDTPMRCR